MNIEFPHPVAKLEAYISRRFALKKKGQKLLGVGFVLGGFILGISFITYNV